MSSSSTIDLQSMRVDLVGSLLRPQSVKDAFASYGEGKVSEADLKQTQDEAIRAVVAKQVAHGLPIIVDGEFRRTSFMESFAVVAGVEEWQAGVKTYHEMLKRNESGDISTHKGQDPILLNRKRVTGRLKLLHNALLDDYRFAQNLTDRPVKVTLIGPDRIQQCYDAEASRSVYPGTAEFLRDVVAVEREMIGTARKRRLPIRRHRCAGLYGVHRCGFAERRCARAAKSRWRLWSARSKPTTR